MIKNKKAETIVGVIVGVIILAFVTLTLTSIINNSRKDQKLFDNYRLLKLLRNNTSNIISKLNTDNIKEDDTFFIFKDKTNKKFIIFTGSTDPVNPSYQNQKYKFINKYGDLIDTNTYEGNIYNRFLWIQREDTSINGEKNQIIKAVVKRLIKKS